MCPSTVFRAGDKVQCLPLPLHLEPECHEMLFLSGSIYREAQQGMNRMGKGLVRVELGTMPVLG